MIPSPWFILGAVLALMGVAGGGVWYGHHQESLVFEAFKANEYAAAEKALSVEQASARAAEEKYTASIAAMQAQTVTETAENAKVKDAAIADLRSGNLRLSSQLARTRAAGVPHVATPAGGVDQASTSELPVDTGVFLIHEAARADNLAILFNEAIQVIAQDRVTCNATPSGK